MKIFGIVLLLIFATVTYAAPPAPHPDEKPAPDLLHDFRAVIGIWQPLPDASATAKPPKDIEEYRFAPIHNGRFVISQEIFRDASGKITYRDFVVFGVDPESHRLFLQAYNTDGSIERADAGESLASPWSFRGTVHGSTRFKDYRYNLTLTDKTHLHILIELMKDGKYERYSEKDYVRKSAEAPATIE
jgi:hypothetical protein